MAPSAVTKPNLNGTNHVNGTSDEEFHTLIRHPLYYIQAADLFFLLRNVQFRVHRYFFERESAYFRAKLSAPASPGAPKLGSSDNEPIVLADVAPTDFEKLLWVFYNPHYSLYPAPASTWSAILALAHKWGMAEVKDFCVRELQMKTVEELGDIDRVVVYHDNDVDRNLLIPVYAALCAREQSLTLPEGLKLGMETTLVIASAREYVRGQVMGDGSRTPITPNVEGEEMEKIIRDFFGIPIPKGSSASVDEVQATRRALSIPARTQNLGPPPKLNVRTTNEPSGARTRNVRPPSPPQPLSQPQQDQSQMETPSASMLQVPTQPQKKYKSGTKKTKQVQPQLVPKVEVPAPTEQSVPTDLPVSITPPTPTQEKQEVLEAPKVQSMEQHHQDDQSPPSLTSRSTQEVDLSPPRQPSDEKQEGGPSLPAEGEREARAAGGEEEVKGDEVKVEAAEAEKVEASTKVDLSAERVKDGETHEEARQDKGLEEPALTTTTIAVDHDETDINQNSNMNGNANNDIETKPDDTQPPPPEPTANKGQPVSIIDATSEETNVETEDSQRELVPPVENAAAEPSKTPVLAEESKPTLPPLTTTSAPTVSPVISATPLLDSPSPGTPQPLSKKKRKALEAARKAAEAQAQAAQAGLQPIIAKEPEPAPTPDPERPKTPPTATPSTTDKPLKLDIDKVPFVPEASDVGTPTSELSGPSTPGTPTGRLSKKHRKALSQRAKKNAAEKAEQEAAAAAAEASPASKVTKAAEREAPKKTEMEQATVESKQEPSGKSTHTPNHPSTADATSAAEPRHNGEQPSNESANLVDVKSNDAVNAQPNADASSLATSNSPPLEGQTIQKDGTDGTGTTEKSQSADNAKGEGEKERNDTGNAADGPRSPAKSDGQPDGQASSTQPSTDAASKTGTSGPSDSQPNASAIPQTPQDQEQEFLKNLPPKPTDDNPDLVPLALQKGRDSQNSSGKGHRARVNSNSSVDPKARPPSWPAPPQSPSTPFSPTTTGHLKRTPSASSSTSAGARSSLSERMAQSIKGSNTNEKAQQPIKKSDEPAALLGKKLKSWFG